LAEGFVGGNSWGDWDTREDSIKALENKTNKWKSGNMSDLQVATFGSNTAISHYKFTYDAEFLLTNRLSLESIHLEIGLARLGKHP
jgi:hypothetical protein